MVPEMRPEEFIDNPVGKEPLVMVNVEELHPEACNVMLMTCPLIQGPRLEGEIEQPGAKNAFSRKFD